MNITFDIRNNIKSKLWMWEFGLSYMSFAKSPFEVDDEEYRALRFEPTDEIIAKGDSRLNKFEEPNLKKLFNKIADSLTDDGYLLIGSTESLTGICPRFVPKRHLRSIFYQKKN